MRQRRVRVWYFPKQAKWGKRVWGEIDKAIKNYDKLIVVCSESSLQSNPVLREIERALGREDQEGKNILFPIAIDDYVFTRWECKRKSDVLEKVVGNFRNWQDEQEYKEAFEQLFTGLQVE